VIVLVSDWMKKTTTDEERNSKTSQKKWNTNIKKHVKIHQMGRTKVVINAAITMTVEPIFHLT